MHEGKLVFAQPAFAQAPIAQARKLYAGKPAGTAYALDTTTVDLCLAPFPWAHFERTEAAIKVHTQMDLRGNIPTFLHIDDGKSYDSDILDAIVPEAGAIYVMDRGFLDFEGCDPAPGVCGFGAMRLGSRPDRVGDCASIGWLRSQRSRGAPCGPRCRPARSPPVRLPPWRHLPWRRPPTRRAPWLLPGASPIRRAGPRLSPTCGRDRIRLPTCASRLPLPACANLIPLPLAGRG